MKIAVRLAALVFCFLAAVSLMALPALAADLPDGDGKDLVKTRCTTCHGLFKATGENKTAEEWAVEVDKMVGAGAVLTDAEFNTIVAYLAKNFGPEEKK